ncbi:DNA-3-methyladenine glycosylase I [Salinimonas marina]|uniref:DNA-3-methyladenine glycosylase I n=1 Tax=Salinimonas marina TaxID=2785918 RepID=A0A7S9HDJ0_9ALTE|nr:DNA-3-methyladenine glycosylase I [Salinimonas marina]QPG05977.1 DNA-3-methyladenine glycosylase I [Salinimonas marina]
MSAESFEVIYRRACERKGGKAGLERLLSQPLSATQVARIPDDRFLAAMTKKVFQSGFVWRVIEQKWPAFEEVFFNFDVEKVLLMPDEMLEKKATDKRIVRNYKKVMTVRANALMIADIRHDYRSFGEFVASFGAAEVTQLWLRLKQHGARLGGNTGPYMLRSLGVDTFLLSQDNEDYLRKHEVFDGGVTSKRSLAAINQQFADWQAQSGRPLTQLSQILSYSWGSNRANS